MDSNPTREQADPASAATDTSEPRPVTGPPHAVLAALTHELRNPLGPVRNAVFLLRARVSPDDQQSAWALDLIDRQVSEMAAMIEDVGEIARLWRGTLPSAVEPIDLRAAAEAAVAASAASREAKQQTLECRMPPEALLVHGERARLTRALAHLLHAAAKAGVAGAALTLRLDHEGANARVYISDAEGAALSLPPARSAVRPTSPLGSSVGMMLAKGIVEQYGGSIAAVGGASDHSRFTVHLPLAVASAHELPPA
ncbi:MAG: histidine kinase dimerization/phospho-acceptor domain-containing protein [Betaproteobacteria bacterium]